MMADTHNLKTMNLMRTEQGNCRTTKMPLTESQKLALTVDEEFAAQIEAYEAQQSAWWLD